MGVSMYDKEAAAKRYETQYALITRKGIHRLLKDFHKLGIRAYEKGDLAAVDIMLDLSEAIEQAQLTARQAEVIDLYYIQDLDQKEAAKQLGVDITTESRHRKAALERITEVFKKWDNLGGSKT